MRVVLAFLFAAFLAQSAPAQRVNVEVQVAGSSTILATPDDYWDSRLGYSTAVSGVVALSSFLSVSAGVELAQKGTEGSYAFLMDIHYLQTPLAARLHLLSAGSPVRPMLFAGVSPAWEVSCRQRITMFVMDAPPSYPQPPPKYESCNSQRTERTDVAAVLGFGIATRIWGRTVSLTYRGERGLRNIAAGYMPGGFPIHNRATVLALTVGLLEDRPPN